MKFSKKIRLISLYFFIIMLVLSFKNTSVSFAATWSSGNIAATTYSSNTTIDLTGNVTLTGMIQINSGATVTIQGAGKIIRGSSNTATMFKVNSGGTLIINGSTGNNNDIIIDGNESITSCKVPLIDCYSNLTLTNVTLKNNVNTAATAGGINIRPNKVNVNITNSVISNCTAPAGSAMYLKTTWSGTINLDKTIIENNYASDTGGTIRTNGGGNGKLCIKESIIRNNSTKNTGGAVYWNANGTNAVLEIIDSQMLKNTATVRGGAMFLEGSKMIISASSGTLSDAILTGSVPSEGIIGTRIQGNTASSGGGGIFINGYKGGAGVGMSSTDSFNLTLEENVIVSENSAEVGGGIGLILNQSDPEDGYTYNVNITGAKLYNNTATTYGGAIYCKLDYKNYNVNVKMSAGEALDNTAENGGAICVSGGDFELSGTAQIRNCQATNGGGLNVSGGNVTINGGTISNCQATNGGGIYISNGDLTMNGGTILNNQATAYGGGIYASSDSQDLKLSITSGSIIGNIASVNGGGVGINIADGYSATVTVGLQECLGLDDTHSHPIIRDNTSNEYGGGFWLNGSNVTMNMYCGSIEENLAIKEPGSSNLYQTGGNATVYAGTIGEGVIVIGGEYVYLPEDDKKEVTIIYNSNIPNAEQTKEALVTIGVEIYLPKTLFTRENCILVGWATVKNPTESDIIYEAGGPFVVTEEETITVYAIWLKEGIGTVETPIINAGKHYDRITGGTNEMIASNASVTIEMTVSGLKPSLYTNRTILFNKNLENGTKITMIDLNNQSNRNYYYYYVTNAVTQNIPLTSFIKNGSNLNYVEITGENEINETFLFIIELPKDNEITGTNQMTLVRHSTDSEVADIKQIVSYTTTNKRLFDLKLTNLEGFTSQNEFKFLKETITPVGSDSRYEGSNTSLIITGINSSKLSEEIKIFDGINYYNINSNGEFIIPFGNVNENKEKSLKLISKTLTENEIGYELKAELRISENESYPGMGEKVAEIECVKLNSINLPAIKTTLEKSVYNQEEFNGSLKLDYQILNLENNTVRIELQKKVSKNSYITQTDKLKSVNEVTQNENGIFEIDLTSTGNINLEFTDGFENQEGTYRILIKTIDNIKSYEILCNFIIKK